MMWREEKCLIVSFLQIASEVPSPEDIVETHGIEFHREEVEVPDWLRTRTAEELAAEILEFNKKEFPEATFFHNISRLFWKSKGFDSRYGMPSEVAMKIEKAEILAERAIRDEIETERRERIEKEKEELPSLVSHCVDWARTNGLKRLTLADIDAYIMERNLEILKETRRALYAMANLTLKSRK